MQARAEEMWAEYITLHPGADKSMFFLSSGEVWDYDGLEHDLPLLREAHAEKKTLSETSGDAPEAVQLCYVSARTRGGSALRVQPRVLGGCRVCMWHTAASGAVMASSPDRL